MTFRGPRWHLSAVLEAAGYCLAAFACEAHRFDGSAPTYRLRFLLSLCAARALDRDGAGTVGGDYGGGGSVGGVSSVLATGYAIIRLRAVHARLLCAIADPDDAFCSAFFPVFVGDENARTDDVLARVSEIELAGAVPAAGATLDWIAYCGRNLDWSVCRVDRVLAALELGELDPDIALAFCLDAAANGTDRIDAADSVAKLVADLIAGRSCRQLRLPPIIV